MKFSLKRFVSVFFIICLMLSMVACTDNSSKINTIVKEEITNDGSLAGKTVIIHSNDVHGAIEGYAKMETLKQQVISQGGTPVLVDAGDFTNGNIYVSISKGESAVTLMNQVGYDLITLGNHEFDFGYENLKTILSETVFTTLCGNIYENNNSIYNGESIVQVGKLKIGFFGLSTPETQTKVNPSMIDTLTFTEKDELYKSAQASIDALKNDVDVIVCIAHLGVDDESIGNRSIDVLNNTEGIDYIIDGHSHTVMTSGENGEKIQSTGTQFENIGVIVIDNETKAIVDNYLVATDTLEADTLVLATARNVIDTVDSEFGAKFAETTVELDGVRANVRTSETNLGDLITDSMIWSVTNTTQLEVDAAHIVAVTNGGGIRASISVGDISRSDVKAVLPFGNTLTVCYVTGSDLLEALEASTQAAPEALGGFPHIAGMNITIDTTKEYDAGEEYPDSTYQRPNSINRVTITEVNGNPFDPNATYAVITNNFCSAGGDTYYIFNNPSVQIQGFDTSIPLDEALVNFIQLQLNGVIDSNYANPQGRITIIK